MLREIFKSYRALPLRRGVAQPHAGSGSSVAQPLKTMKTRACVIDFLSCISYTGTSYPDWVSS